jgi:hypothetical protein
MQKNNSQRKHVVILRKELKRMSTNLDDIYQNKWDELYYDALDKELNKGINFHEADGIAIGIADANVDEAVTDSVADAADYYNDMILDK